MKKWFGITLYLLSFALSAPVVFAQDAVIIGTSVRVRSAPDINSDEVAKVNTGDAGAIEEVGTEWKALSGDDYCEKHPWVKVKFLNGVTGWVYGSFVYKIFEAGNDMFPGEKVWVDFKEFELRLCQNFSNPVADENGLTGCTEFYPLVLFVPNQNGLNFLEIVNHPHPESPVFQYWNLASDEGRGDRIVSTEQRDRKVFTAQIQVSYQEGCGSFSVRVEKKDNKYVATAMAYTRSYNQEDCE